VTPKLLVPVIALYAVAAVAADAPAVTATAQMAATSDAKSQNDSAKSVAKTDTGPKALSGMSILGNQEAPKALVIVPWKSSQLGDSLGIAKTLDDGRQPVDKDVFMRQLSYYQIRAGSK
jgi:hypothetical protein